MARSPPSTSPRRSPSKGTRGGPPSVDRRRDTAFGRCRFIRWRAGRCSRGKRRGGPSGPAAPPSPTTTCSRTPRERPGGPMLRRCCARILRAAGLPDQYDGHNLTAHALRRSFSTWLSEADVEEATRDRPMGHARGSVAERHYTATLLTKLQRAIQKIVLSPSVVAPPPLRAVPSAADGPQAAGHTAVLTAGLPRPAVRGPTKPLKSSGTPGRTRTCDPRLRRPLLYPTELRARFSLAWRLL